MKWSERERVVYTKHMKERANVFILHLHTIVLEPIPAEVFFTTKEHTHVFVCVVCVLCVCCLVCVKGSGWRGQRT